MAKIITGCIVCLATADQEYPPSPPDAETTEFDASQSAVAPYWQNDAMENRHLLPLCAVMASALTCAALPPAVAADPAPIQREIIPGSELMTAQERERYRLRLRGAATPEERERLRAEHVRAMEERAQLRGLQVIDYSRLKNAP